MRRNPLSSMKTRWPPSLSSFFYRRPLVPLPVVDGFLVSLERSTLWDLTAPVKTAEDLPDVAGVVFDVELLPDHGGDPLQRPEVVWKSREDRPVHKDFQQPLALLVRQLPRTSRHRLGGKRRLPTLCKRFLPTKDG